MKTDYKEIIKKFLAKAKLFKNVKTVMMHAISVGCIKLSVECVSEFMISKYNLHDSCVKTSLDISIPNVGTLSNKTLCFKLKAKL